MERMNAMYFYEAVNRINKIEWKEAEETTENYEMDLGHEYLRRMAEFINKQDLEPNINPLFVNVASELGDRAETNYVEYCSLEVQEALINNSLPRYILNCYLQLADYVDHNKELERYLRIYEPLIQLLERGFLFAFREGGFMVYNVAFYPLRGEWYKRCLNAQPKSVG